MKVFDLIISVLCIILAVTRVWVSTLHRNTRLLRHPVLKNLLNNATTWSNHRVVFDAQEKMFANKTGNNNKFKIKLLLLKVYWLKN